MAALVRLRGLGALARAAKLGQQQQQIASLSFFAQKVVGAGGTSTGNTGKVSLVEKALKDEQRRQRDELILIPSESICIPEAESLMASCFGNLYAEGQPTLRLARASPDLAVDDDFFHAWHRRLNDARYYRGCVEADRVELLAKYYVAQAFSLLDGSPSADNIHVNVQALSGGPANLAIYDAFLDYGDPILTLNLAHGGHLSHGSPFNVSGKHYNAKHYNVDPVTHKLNYDAIRRQALEQRPKMIVGGASAYSWDFDWPRLREIADEVGAHLHADVCHLAGLIVGGQLSNPLPYADTVMFTTHKTMMGPRGSVIVTKCAEKAKAIDTAVFPGFQGGPHVNNIAGIARMFEMIVHNRDDFCRLQRDVIDNAQTFANALKKEGFTLEYGGGTENHLMLIDLKDFKVSGGNVLDGETASRLLENVGIVVNKNTLPGDETAADSTGIRVATPWLTQRGIKKEQLEELASIIGDLLRSATGFQVWAPSGDEKCRARVPYEKISEARQRVRAITDSLPYPVRPAGEATDTNPIEGSFTHNGLVGMLVRGEKTRLGMDQALTCNVLDLDENQLAHGMVLDRHGKVISEAFVAGAGWHPNPACGPNGEERMLIFVPEQNARQVYNWLNCLSDGYVQLEDNDPYLKVDGPFSVSPIRDDHVPVAVRKLLDAASPANVSPAEAPETMLNPTKPYFVGQSALGISTPALPAFEFTPEEKPLAKTVLHAWHADHGAQLVPFSGWEMPLKYGDGIFAEHAAVRSSAGIFDVSHMSAVGIEGPYALAFLEAIMANTAARLIDNEAQYSYIVREDGTALDDAYVYRVNRHKFMIVFNAANFERDWAWLNAVNEGRVCIDPHNPGKRMAGQVKLTQLRDAGSDSLLDIAFQGPKSLDILSRLVDDPAQRADLQSGKLNTIHHVNVKGIPLLAARTGYTGESIGFELFVHPDQTVDLWEMILDEGRQDGAMAAGLGARDSTRIEAGFPLFGQELEGPEQLSLTEADYGYVSRFHRPFYIGRDAYIARTHPRRKRLLRLQGSGRKSVRPGHAVLDHEGKPIGTVTSFAFTSSNYDYTAIAAVDAKTSVAVGDEIRVARMGKDQVKGEVPDSKCVNVSVLPRFPTPEEKESWREKYWQA